MGYGACEPSTDYPAVHQPTNTTATPHETKTDTNQKKLLSPQQVVFRKPADYKL